MGRVVLGQGAPAGVLTVHGAENMVEWSTSGTDIARVAVLCTGPSGAGVRQIMAEAPSGRESVPWLPNAIPCTFQLETGDGTVLARVVANVGATVSDGSAPAPATGPPPSPGERAAAVLKTDLVPGIPNLYLALGAGGIVLLAFLKKKR